MIANTRLAIGALTVLLAASAQGAGGTLDFVMTIDGQQEVPPVATSASGSGTATLDTGTNLFSWDITYAGLSGPAIAAHFHGPAPACDEAGVEVGILEGGGPPEGTIKGSATLDAGQVADLLAGLWYVNIHTSANSGGEIRGLVAPPPLDDPLPDIPPGDVHVQLELLADGLVAPNWGATAPGDDRLFVTDQPGILWAIDTSTGAKTVFLDVSDRLVSLGIFGEGSFDERGLLGVAFHPDYQLDGRLYTYTSEPVRGTADFSTIPGGADANHQSVITEWQVRDPADPAAVADPGSARVLMIIDQPQFNHDGGGLNFGPDGLLYISLGDGGDADDEDGGTSFGVPTVGHGCTGNGRDIETVLGSILRIDPLGDDSANGQYGLPADNPFVGARGLDEIYAYGFRNPFRFSFDSAGGELYVGDVGQNDIEEIHTVVNGGNYGWNQKEGSFVFVGNGLDQGYVTDRPLAVDPGVIDPIAEYDHDDGLAVIGGFVYRGTRNPALAGRYVFGEFARNFNSDGRLFHLDEQDAIKELQLVGGGKLGLFLLGMGQDASGELYALVNETGTPFEGKSGPTGRVLRIGLKTGDLDANGIVDIDDLMQLLEDWGLGDVAADLDLDGVVGTSDLLLLLANWG